MSSKSDLPLKIELTIQAENPQLLEGLDLWLRLGLISDAQVKRICQYHLVCSLPEVRSQKSEVRSQKSEVRSQKSKVRSQKSKVKSQKSKVFRNRGKGRGKREEGRS